MKVSRGKVTTYKELAKSIGSEAYRAVGNALNKNKHPKRVPCYRVINSDGRLGGYSEGLKKKVELLKRDGIKIKNEKIDLKTYEYRFK